MLNALLFFNQPDWQSGAKGELRVRVFANKLNRRKILVSIFFLSVLFSDFCQQNRKVYLPSHNDFHFFVGLKQKIS